MEKKNLPTLRDLHNSPEVAFKQDELKLLLNQTPHASWVKTNKYANNSQYLPIDKVEFLLDYIFQEWKVEIIQSKQLFNAVEVSIRLHYLNPVTGVWMHHDGIGASEIQTKSESGPLKMDLSNIGKGAVEMAAPKAKTAAIKDAADHLGKLFGRDLNRKDTVAFTGAYNMVEATSPTATPISSNFNNLEL